MKTRAGDVGDFADFDLYRVPSPSFVVDRAKLRANLAILADVRLQSGAKILAALKAFAMWACADDIAAALDGVCASGLYEARLGREHYGGIVSCYSPAYKPADIPAICALSNHVIFNSLSQKSLCQPQLTAARESGADFEVGLRINPQYSSGTTAKYDPAAPYSRLGIPISQIATLSAVECAAIFAEVDGIHLHMLCEQDFLPLAASWQAVAQTLAPIVPQLSWINLGGGHHITRADYQRAALIDFLRDLGATSGCDIILEPGEAVALDVGILVGEIVDVIDNGMPIAITDISATCHMPDVLEAPYRPTMIGEIALGDGEDSPKLPAVRFGGPSCLAGDVIGDYHLPTAPQIGQRIAFLDQAHYSMVKTTMFNGVPLPSLWLWDSASDRLEQIRAFDYQDFKHRLS